MGGGGREEKGDKEKEDKEEEGMREEKEAGGEVRRRVIKQPRPEELGAIG